MDVNTPEIDSKLGWWSEVTTTRRRSELSLQRSLYFNGKNEARKVFDCVDHKKQWKILKEMGIPDYLTRLLKNLYAGQEATLGLDMEKQTGSK